MFSVLHRPVESATHSGHARAAAVLGCSAGAQADANRALEAARAIPFDSTNSLYFGLAQELVGEVALRSGRSEEARGALRAALLSLERSIGTEHPRVLNVRELLRQAGG